MKFKNKNHQALFTTAANKLNRSDNVKMSVFYLLTADVRLWNASKHHIKKGYIDLDSIKVKNGNFRYALASISSDLSLKHNVTVSLTVKPHDDFMLYSSTLPFYANVIKEGIRYGA